jgi:phage tail-like protein
VVERVRLTAPRDSWLQHLPSVFSQSEGQREFLERYLAIAQATWDEVEKCVGSFERFLDPSSVPPEYLAYLASWLDLRLEGTLDAEQNRTILSALPGLWRDWGTVRGMRAWVRVHLAALSGLPVDVIEKAGLPGIVERFVDRRSLVLGRKDLAGLCASGALFGPSVERRFQVGVFDREGEIELVSAGEPDLDLFRHYAHRFRIYAPASWVRTPEAEALLRRAIDLQRPAHTTFDLVLVEPRFRIGEQSTLELDTVIGGDLSLRLGCATDAAGRAPSSLLGYDTTIAGRRRVSQGPAIGLL